MKLGKKTKKERGGKEKESERQVEATPPLPHEGCVLVLEEGAIQLMVGGAVPNASSNHGGDNKRGDRKGDEPPIDATLELLIAAASETDAAPNHGGGDKGDEDGGEEQKEEEKGEEREKDATPPTPNDGTATNAHPTNKATPVWLADVAALTSNSGNGNKAQVLDILCHLAGDKAAPSSPRASMADCLLGNTAGGAQELSSPVAERPGKSLAEADTRFGTAGFTGSETGLDVEWAEAEPETASKKQKEWRLRVMGGKQKLMDATGSFWFTFLANKTFAPDANDSSARKEDSFVLPSVMGLRWLKMRREAKSMGMSMDTYLDYIQQSNAVRPKTNSFRTHFPLAQRASTVAAAASRGDPITTSPDCSIQDVTVPRKLPAKDTTLPLTRTVPAPSPAADPSAKGNKKKKAAKAIPTPTGPVAEPTPAAAASEEKRKTAKSAGPRVVNFVVPAATAAKETEPRVGTTNAPDNSLPRATEAEEVIIEGGESDSQLHQGILDNSKEARGK